MRNFSTILFAFCFFSCFAFSQPKYDLQNKYMLAESYQEAGQLEKAQALYEEVYQKDPANRVYFESLNNLYISLKLYDASIQVVSKRITLTPEDIVLYGDLAKAQYLSNNETEAFKTLDAAVERFKNDMSSYRIFAGTALELRAFDKGIEILKAGKERFADNMTFAFDLAQLYTLKMEFTNAAAEYYAVIQAMPDQLMMIEGRILSYAKTGDFIPEVIRYFSEQSANEIPAALRLIANLSLALRDYKNAFEYYKQLDKLTGGKGADVFQCANAALIGKEYTLASDAYKYIIDTYSETPILPQVRLGYAKTLEASVMAAHFSDSLSWMPVKPKQISATEPFNSVIEAYKIIISTFRQNDAVIEAQIRIGSIYSLLGDISAAQDRFRLVLRDFPYSPFYTTAALLLAETEERQDRFDEAISILNTVIASKRARPEETTEAKYRMALIHYYRGEFTEAKKRMNDVTGLIKDDRSNDALDLSFILNTALNDSASLALFAEGEKFIMQGEFSRAAEKFRTARQNKQSFLVFQRAGLRLAETETALGNYSGAIDVLTECMNDEFSVYADRAVLLIADIYQYGLHDIPKAYEKYELLLAQYPSSLYLDRARQEILKLRSKGSV